MAGPVGTTPLDFHNAAQLRRLRLFYAVEPDPPEILGYYDVDMDEPMLKDAIRDALSTLTPREAMVIRLRFGLADGVDKTLRETGEVMGLSSRERVRQIGNKAIRKLRHRRKLKTFYEEDNNYG